VCVGFCFHVYFKIWCFLNRKFYKMGLLGFSTPLGNYLFALYLYFDLYKIMLLDLSKLIYLCSS
jgi:hypothetical protein